MLKKGLLVLIIVALVAGGAFAQNSYSSMAKNTITVDVGPTIAGFFAGQVASMAVGLVTDEISDIKSSGFSIAAQYERQLIKQLSIAVRAVYGIPELEFAYKGIGNPKLNATSMAGEGHVRFYPFGETFFVDGMVGYAYLAAELSGTVSGLNGSAKDSSNYFKYGAKTGWRISFGKNGGFTFEPSLGWSFGIPLGDNLGKKLSAPISGTGVDVEKAVKAFEDYAFIGGPRVSLGLGYRF